MNDHEKPFFVGYLPVPAALRTFLVSFSVGLALFFGVVAWGIGTTQTDPGPGAFRFDFGQQRLTGVMTERPYPMLHVIEGTNRVPQGKTILLAGNGKNGVQSRTQGAEGQIYRVQGPILRRGDLDMMQVRGGTRGLTPVQQAADEEIPHVDLGRWRLAGEICDGKCLAGAMRPGRGLAHRACANLCLIGGVPPVFVSSQPVEGEEFMLMGGPDGGPLTEKLLEFTALYIEVEGQLNRVGGMMVFLIDPATIKVL